MPPKKKQRKKDAEMTKEELQELGIFQDDDQEDSPIDEKEYWRDYC